MVQHNVCLVGGTGFVGRHLVSELTRAGHHIRVLTRHRERHRELLVHPTLELVETNVHDRTRLAEAVGGHDVVVNLAGILNQSRHSTERFDSVHVQLAANVAAACESSGIPRLLHMSALGAGQDGPSDYLKSKAAGERQVHDACSTTAVTSFRPSVIFGHDDDFFNRFATLLAMTPLVFPLACPNTRFAPVFVGDVAQAFVRSIDDKRTFGQHYDLCGPRVYTLKALVEYTAKVRGLKRSVWGLSDGLSRLQARALELAPGKPFSVDNYLSMQMDSVSDSNSLGALGITPTSVEAVVPGYLGTTDPNARYQSLRAFAGRH